MVQRKEEEKSEKKKNRATGKGTERQERKHSEMKGNRGREEEKTDNVVLI